VVFGVIGAINAVRAHTRSPVVLELVNEAESVQQIMQTMMSLPTSLSSDAPMQDLVQLRANALKLGTDALCESEQLLEDVLSFETSAASARVRWELRNKNKARRLTTRLRDVRSTLMMCLSTENLYENPWGDFGDLRR
jgi:hypothetical protein